MAKKPASPLPLAAAAEDHEHEVTLIEGTNQSDEIILGHGAGGGRQHIVGGNGEDTLGAGGGPDTVEGGNGRDYLMGGGGPDLIEGGNGKDTLVGGMGPDTLVGGEGADLFVYTAHTDDDHGPGPGGEEGGGEEGGGEESDGHEGEDPAGRRETIADFQTGLDDIDLSALDLDGFADAPTALAVWVEQDGEDTLVKVDLDGSLEGEHTAELTIVLLGLDAAALSAADFIF
ncbi:type I secretion C-terminal target domain-containing protein [Falsiroseomonas sp.]|uniref:type I secretion C-terminal target domain-containing protein n=1 Tax=Falsiroseomonas sp. TaxID=2870721 RepID=UPI00356379F2